MEPFHRRRKRCPEPAVEREGDIHLGGKVYRVRTYGELVTAVIHPSHDIAKGYDEEEVVSATGESLLGMTSWGKKCG